MQVKGIVLLRISDLYQWLVIAKMRQNLFKGKAQYFLQALIGGVATGQPDDLRRRAVLLQQFTKILILAHHHAGFCFGPLKYFPIARIS